MEEAGPELASGYKVLPATAEKVVAILPKPFRAEQLLKTLRLISAEKAATRSGRECCS